MNITKPVLKYDYWRTLPMISKGVAIQGSVQMRDLADHLLATGEPVVAIERIAVLTGLEQKFVHAGLTRLRDKGRIFSPARGLYVAVPAEYRAWKVVPAEWFIDPMMRHLNRHYYVGLLSAAAMHGAAHHAPQVFQVMVDRQLGARSLERVRLHFYVNRLLKNHAEALPTQTRNTHTGNLIVASPELTAVDLVSNPQRGGGLHNIANVLIELPRLDEKELGRVVASYPRVVARRLGWLLETFAGYQDLEAVRAAAAPEEGDFLPLSGPAPRRGLRDRRWGLILNTDVEPDIELPQSQ